MRSIETRLQRLERLRKSVQMEPVEIAVYGVWREADGTLAEDELPGIVIHIPALPDEHHDPRT
jgi:hypothetical protein